MADGMKIFSMFGDIFIKDNDVDTKLDKIDKKASKLNISLSGLSNDAGKSIRSISKDFDLWVSGTDKAGNSSEYLKKKLDSLNKVMEIERKDIEKSKEEYQKIVEKFGEGSKQAEKYANKITNLKISHNKLAKEVENVKKEYDKATDKLEKYGNKLETINSKMTKWGTVALGTITAVGGVLLGLTNKTADAADKIDKMSIRTGISNARLQELKYASGQVGVNFDSITGAVTRMTMSMDKADEGNKSLTEAFRTLRIDVNGTNGKLKDTGQIFDEVLLKLAEMPDKTERNTLALKIFGKGAAELIPLFDSGKKGIEELSQRAHDLGLVMSDETVAAGVKFGDTMMDIQSSVDGAKNKLIEGLLPAAQSIADYLLENMPQIQQEAKKIGEKIGSFVLYVSENAPTIIEWIKAITAVWVIQKGVLGALAIAKFIDWGAEKLIGIETAINTKGTVAYTMAQKAQTVTTAVSTGATTLFTRAKRLLNIETLINTKNTIAHSLAQKAQTATTAIATGATTLFGGALTLTSGKLLLIAGAIIVVVGLIFLLVKGFNQANAEIKKTMNSFGEFSNIQIPQINPNMYNMPNIPNMRMPGMPGLATGGIITRAGSVLVGENGPEILNLNRGASVIPLDKTGGTINIYATIPAKELKEMQDITDFFKRINQVGRQGVK